MTYIQPMVRVYQELANAGGGAAINPELPAAIVGLLKNIVEINMDDEAKKAISRAAQVTDFTGTVQVSNSFPGQVIEDNSVKVLVANALVKTYRADVDFSADTPVLAVNELGPTGSNGFNDNLSFATSKHVEIGDIVVISDSGSDANPVVSFVTSLNTQTGAFDTAAGIGALNAAKRVTVYKKFAELNAPRNGWSNGVNLANIYPASTSSTNEYEFASEVKVKGSGSKADIHIGYAAKRKDLVGLVTINGTADITNKLGAITTDNPLAYGASKAIGASGGRAISVLAIDPALEEGAAFNKAFEFLEGFNVYAIAAMTANPSVSAALKAHVKAMSTPQAGKWRVGISGLDIPDILNVLGTTTSGIKGRVSSVDAGSKEATITLTDGNTVGDTRSSDVVSMKGETFPSDPMVGGYDVIDASQYTMVVSDPSGNLSANSEVEFRVVRAASKEDQAAFVAAQCKTFGDKRAWIVPGDALVNEGSVDKEVPGFYVAAGVAGYVSGVAPQVGITKVTMPGFAGMVHSNFYFTERQLNTMAGAGALLYVQEAQGTTPYCRHGLTTDMSVLEYREIVKVKNLDYLSYYFKRITDPFIGTWNINSDTVRTVRQVLDSAGSRLVARKLPKVGAPLVNYSIQKVAQNAKSKDAMDIEISVAIGDPNNYMNIHLIV